MQNSPTNKLDIRDKRLAIAVDLVLTMPWSITLPRRIGFSLPGKISRYCYECPSTSSESEMYFGNDKIFCLRDEDDAMKNVTATYEDCLPRREKCYLTTTLLE